MIKAIIFDLDGLLSDTERLHMQSYQEILSRYDIKLSDQVYMDHWIRDGKGVFEFVQENSLNLDTDILREEKIVLYRKMVRQSGVPMPGAIDTVGQLSKSFKTALASNSYRKNVELVLECIGLGDAFPVVLAQGDVQKVKPEPDIFLKAAKLLQVPPADCLVIEDAEKGIVAASRAGMKSVAIPNEYTSDNNFSLATVRLNNLNELTNQLITNL